MKRMLVKIDIFSAPIDMQVQTVLVAIDNLDPQASVFFRCYHCGTVVARIRGKVLEIKAGLVPTNQVSTLHQCYKCKENYTFQSVRPKKISKNIKLTLSPEIDRSVSTFHCITCRNPLLQYNDYQAYLLPNLTPIYSGTDISCINQACPRRYLFNEVVSL